MFKKIAALVLSLSLCFALFSVSAANVSAESITPETTASNSNVPTTGVPSTDPNHAQGLYNTGTNTSMSTMATGLLASVSLEVYLLNGNTLLLEGSTDGTETLSKIGYQDITLQRYENGQWVNVKVWSEYKSNSYNYDYDYETTVAAGYYYRFTTYHYGENDWLIFSSVQTIYNETSYLYVG